MYQEGLVFWSRGSKLPNPLTISWWKRSLYFKGVLEWPFWTKLVVVAIGFTGGLVFMYVQCKAYVQLWRRLKAYNRVIFVQNCPDTAKKQEKNFSCHVNTDVKETVVVPVLPAGTNALPSAEGSPPEVIPVWWRRVDCLRWRRPLQPSATTSDRSDPELFTCFIFSPFGYWLTFPLLGSERKGGKDTKWPGSHQAESKEWYGEVKSVLKSHF